MAINDPRDIDGLVLWYSAEAETGYTDNQVMTQWTDLSGNGNHAIPGAAAPKWCATAGSAGGPTIDFTASQYFDLPDNLMNSYTSGTMAVTLRTANGSSGAWNFGSSGNITHFVYSGWIYDSFGSTAQHTVATASGLTWYRYQARAQAGAFKAWLNGANVYTEASNTVGWTSTNYWIGRSNASWPMNGYISGFVVYDHNLTDAEVADLDAWQAANPAGGVPVSGGGGALTWFDGGAEQAATLDGWWDGSAVQIATLEGWWDGTAVQPLA